MKTQTFYVFIIINLLLYACSINKSDTKLHEETIKSQNISGVALQLDKVQISDEKTLIQVSLAFDTSQISVVDQWSVGLKDEAPKVIKEHITAIIKGGGGGQKNLATAGGQDASNLNNVIDTIRNLF